MHLPIFAGNGTVFFKHYCRVVVQAGGAAFEKACYQHNTAFSRQSAVEISNRTRYCHGEGAEIHVFGLAEV